MADKAAALAIQPGAQQAEQVTCVMAGDFIQPGKFRPVCSGTCFKGNGRVCGREQSFFGRWKECRLQVPGSGRGGSPPVGSGICLGAGRGGALAFTDRDEDGFRQSMLCPPARVMTASEQMARNIPRNFLRQFGGSFSIRPSEDTRMARPE